MVTQEVELPVLPTALLTRCAGEPYVFALDGGDAASWGAGHALLGFRPRATLRVTAGGEAVVRSGGSVQHWCGDPFALLDRFCAEWAIAGGPAGRAGGSRGLVSYAGGVITALSYDLRHWVEPRLGFPRDHRVPVLHAAFYDWLLSYSYAERRYSLASACRSRSELERLATHFQALASRTVYPATVATRAHVVPDLTRGEYCAAVRAVLDYIAAGDVYQVNLAQRFVVTDPPAPAGLFAAMQHEQAMPFAAYVDAGDFVLVSNSPECFLTLRDDGLATFPVKGTRRRGQDASSDQCLVRDLLEDPKERAEHVMIVDLERNDLGKVCQTGSIRVDAFASVHTFPSLHHLVSKVSGRLRPSTSLAGVLRATFPGGSITGAPKIRAMEIIDMLEPVRRGFYTGAIGFIGDGGAWFNLAIRTAIAIQQQITYHAGGGIVADSVPEREYEETLLKAQPFLTALAARAA
jgi:para-aminobenzoate synthetase component 1